MTGAAGAVLFSDLVGFTEFNGARGDDVAVQVLDRHRSLMDGSLTDGSRVVKELGDGLLVWCPEAPEVLTLATDFQRAVGRARERDDFPLAVRVGVHYGSVQPRGDDIVGQTVNIAARIVDLTGPGEVLLSEQTLAACGDHAVGPVESIGPVTAKGVADPIWLHRLVIDRAVNAGCE